jgi:hypothetical protein
MDSTMIRDQLLAFLAQRYHGHVVRDLTDYMFANHLFHAVDPALIDFAHTYREGIGTYLAQPIHVDVLVAYCMRATKQYTYQRNQFINYTNNYDHVLHTEYRDLFARLHQLLHETASRDDLARGMATLVAGHHERLRLILASYCVSYQAGDLAEHPLLQTVPCEAYSARFQLQVLGLDVTKLREPVLDIGCGSAGNLVNFLRRKGYAAFGIDRLAPIGDSFFQSDWFDFDYTQQAWGTVIAHHALSTHFIYHHLHQTTTAPRYAKLYLAVLQSLAPGGSFCYAPGVPFFEEYLRALPGYPVTKTRIAPPTVLDIGEIAYATTITK